MPGLTYDEKVKLYRLLKEKEARQETGGFMAKFWPDDGPLSWKNYPKHMEFIAAGKEHRERFASYANRTGKTIMGSIECASHLLGDYYDWWPGRKFDHPIDMWAAGISNTSTRDIIQKELLGPPGAWGTGMIPADRIANIRRKPGVPDAVDSFKVKHSSGGWSYCGLKSYEQGRDSFQGTAKHLIWLDELPPAEVYGECLVRTMTTQGIVIVTATPLQGLTPFVQSFMDNAVKSIETPEVTLDLLNE